jgi:probable rRNA maturation factor
LNAHSEHPPPATSEPVATVVETDYGSIPLLLQVQRACAAADLATDAELLRWVGAALAQGLKAPRGALELGLRIVDDQEGAELNQRYRGRDGATNVLSFPFDAPEGLPPEIADAMGAEWNGQLGDIVICAPVLRREAAEQGKQLDAHTAHLVVHGTLHLLGFDHINPADAVAMETLESVILAGLGFPSPYEVDDDPRKEPYDE